MYEAVFVDDGAHTTPARFASAAARLGFDGIVMFGDISPELRARIAQEFELDIAIGCLVEGNDRDQASRGIEAKRSSADIIAVRTSSQSLQRYFANRELIDLLVTDGEIEHTTGKLARDNGIAITLNVGPVVGQHGDARVSAIQAIYRLHRIIAQYELPYVVTTEAHSHLELRAPRELDAIGASIGLNDDVIQNGLSMWNTLVERTRKTRDDRFIEPGVNRVDHETDDR